jgi:O-antigen/teichoic acid export membrane protein
VSARILLKGAADAAGKAVTLVITVLAARTLIPDAFGVMALAMATGWLVGVATDAGLSMYLAREAARQGRESRGLLVAVLQLRAGFAFVSVTLLAFLTPSLVPNHWEMHFALLVLAQILGAVTDTVSHYFRGIGRSEIESAIHAAHRFTTLVLALVVLTWWPQLEYLAAAMLAPAALAVILSLAIAWRLSGNREPGTGTREPGTGSREPGTGNREPILTPARFTRDVLPLGAAVLLSALYFRIDVYFVEHWQGLQAVGAYNAVFRLVEAMRLLPAAVMAVTFPMLVQAADTRLVQRIGAGLGAIGAALAIACGLGAPFIVALIYGQAFVHAAPAFAILSLALPLFFLNYALTHQVIGWDGQHAYLVIVVVALIVNIAANVVLVPTQGMVGAAIGTVLTEVVVTAGCISALRAVRHEGSARGFGAEVQHEGSAS